MATASIPAKGTTLSAAASVGTLVVREPVGVVVVAVGPVEFAKAPVVTSPSQCLVWNDEKGSSEGSQNATWQRLLDSPMISMWLAAKGFGRAGHRRLRCLVRMVVIMVVIVVITVIISGCSRSRTVAVPISSKQQTKEDEALALPVIAVRLTTDRVGRGGGKSLGRSYENICHGLSGTVAVPVVAVRLAVNRLGGRRLDGLTQRRGEEGNSRDDEE